MNEKIWNEKALYFRISEDGFMCKIPDGKSDVAVLHPDLKDLEAILQAVKKTQEKILNKRIQEIQDSKNTFSEPEPPYTDDDYKKFQMLGYPKPEKVEQNQKIVDEYKTKITKEDIQLLKTAGWCEEESQDCDWKKVEQIEKQIIENQKIVDKIIKRIENNKAVLMDIVYPDNIDPESIEWDKILERYKKVEQEQALIKDILQGRPFFT